MVDFGCRIHRYVIFKARTCKALRGSGKTIMNNEAMPREAGIKTSGYRLRAVPSTNCRSDHARLVVKGKFYMEDRGSILVNISGG